MISWFRKRRAATEIDKFERVLSDKLGHIFPAMKDLRDNSRFLFSSYSDDPAGINFVYSMGASYYERHGRKHRVNFKVDGLEIKRKNGNEFVKIPVFVSHDLIGRVEIDNPSDFWKNYDLTTIRVGEIKRTELEFVNEDVEALKKILQDIDDELTNKLEVDDSAEIEIGGKRYYTILKMEDGNHIAVDSRGKVYRLQHDSDDPAELINRSIEDFLNSYSGNKRNLDKLFD